MSPNYDMLYVVYFILTASTFWARTERVAEVGELPLAAASVLLQLERWSAENSIGRLRMDREGFLLEAGLHHRWTRLLALVLLLFLLLVLLLPPLLPPLCVRCGLLLVRCLLPVVSCDNQHCPSPLPRLNCSSSLAGLQDSS